jgi:small nuclear ribonucleoprotein (snRNP)-like protein
MVRAVYPKPRDELTNIQTYIQLMFSVFKTLTDQTVIVELKNDLCITGVLKSVDQYVLLCIVVTSPYQYFVPRYLNIRLDTIKVQNPDQHPHMVNSAALYFSNVTLLTH